MKYLKKFETLAQFNVFKNSDNYFAPNVSFINDQNNDNNAHNNDNNIIENIVNYNPLIMINPSITMNNWTYGETPSTPIITGNIGNAKVSYMYKISTANDKTYQLNMPNNAGTYTIKANIEPIRDYSSGSCTTTFTITKANLSASVSVNNWAYGETPSTPYILGNNGNGSVTYLYKLGTEDDSTYTSTVPSNIGTYNIKVQIDETTNYNSAIAINTFTITKGNPIVVAPTAKVLTYNGSSQELVNAGSVNIGTLKYSLDNSTWSTNIPTAINYGSYTVYYKVDGDNNINDVAAQTVACSINEKQVNATIELSQYIYTYNNTEKQPTVTVKDGNTIINSNEYTVTYSNNINAGTATVTITDNIGGNYNVIGSTTFTINKANINPIVSMNNWNESETASNPTVSGNLGNGIVTYMYKVSTANDSTYTSTKPSTPGTYTIKAQIAETNNYNSAICTSTFEITNGLEELSGNRVLCKYNVTDTSQPTKLVDYDIWEYNGSGSGSGDGSSYTEINISLNINSMEIDGVEQSKILYEYQFNTLGEHTVLFTLNESSIYGGFKECTNLKSVLIGNGITSVSNGFYYCTGLNSITLGSGVTSFDNYSLYGCSNITSIKVNPNNQTYDCRNNCNAIIRTSNNELCNGCQNTIIPNSVTSIGQYAFGSCSSLTSITIPNSVTSISAEAFSGCSNLISVTIDSNSIISYNRSSSGSSIHYTFGSQVEEYILGNSITAIGNYTFNYCSDLKSITIPNSVTSIGQCAFGYCRQLTSITIPNSVTSIGQCAFEYCSGLISLTVGNSLNTLGRDIFNYCTNLTSIIWNSPLSVIRDDTFDDGCNKIASVTINNTSVDKIVKNIFGSQVTEYILSNSVTSICAEAFKDCSSLTSLTLSNNLTSISNYSFQNCTGLTSITIPASVTSISTGAFSGCSNITSLTLSNNLTSISNYSFQNCTGLTSITIPASVTSISGGAFTGCSNLTSVTINSDSLISTDYTNNSNSSTQGLFYKFGTQVTEYILPNSVTKIGNRVFSNCSSLTSITIPNSVTSIGQYAFGSCSSLTSITIPNSVTSISAEAFYNCTGLTNIILPNLLTYISGGLFRQCTSLNSVTIPASVTVLGGNIFTESGITSVICNAIQAPSIDTTKDMYDRPASGHTFYKKTNITVYVPTGATGYNDWPVNIVYQ